MASKRTKESSPTSITPEGVLIHLNPSKILAEDNIRYGEELSTADVEDMKASILEVGRIMEPVGVEPLEKPINGFTHRLRYGFRRVAGALAANKEGAGVMVPAMVLEPVEGVRAIQESVRENVDRKTLSPMDMAVAIKRMLDEGMSREDVRGIFRRPKGTKGGANEAASNAWLNMALRLLDLPKPIQAKIHDGRVDFSAAYLLGRVPPEKLAEVVQRAESAVIKLSKAEEAEEKKYQEMESRLTDATAKEEAATVELDGAAAEVEIAEKSVALKQEQAAAAYAASQKASKEDKKKAEEHRKAAEADAKSAEKLLTEAKKKADALTATKTKLAESAAEIRTRLEAVRKAAAAKPKTAKVSSGAVRKAAKEVGVDSIGHKQLGKPEMRKAIAELALMGGSYPKVEAIAQAIQACFDGIDTPAQLLKKLATLTGEYTGKGKKSAAA